MHGIIANINLKLFKMDKFYYHVQKSFEIISYKNFLLLKS